MTEIPAIRFRQWLEMWDDYPAYDATKQRAKPEADAYLFALPASRLRALSGVFRRHRTATDATGLQRGHEPSRSYTIREYVKYGYPFGGLTERQRTSSNESLKKPGWLPTSIVVNILSADEQRRGRSVAPDDVVSIAKDRPFSTICLPFDEGETSWRPSALPPIEIIDGQHRLWAFGEEELDGDFELPVVAFHNLDVGWQAYLFWAINVSPKKINPSHAFDLYPLLRTQDWLETQSELRVYREARAQELADVLFTHPASPWQNRINMLGEKKADAPQDARVTQAGWVRALSATFLSPGKRGADGLFSVDIPNLDADRTSPLRWTRAQQAALLIYLWKALSDQIESSNSDWVQSFGGDLDLSEELGLPPPSRLAFIGPHTMLNQEQGVRAVLAVANDVLFQLAVRNRVIFDWQDKLSEPGEFAEQSVISELVGEIADIDLGKYIDALAAVLSEFDWRSSQMSKLSLDERMRAAAFRGSGGYTLLREAVLRYMASYANPFREVAILLLGERL
jgi:DGQHR domain-containing protein